MKQDAAGRAHAVRRRVDETLAGVEFPVSRALWLERIEIYAGLLTVWGRTHNLIASAQDQAAVAFHIIDCLTPLGLPEGQVLLKAGTAVLDLGSGAGLPGLVIAAVGEARVTLLESRRKRVSFLTAAASAMRLANVAVEGRHVRAIDLAPEYDVVTGRAFAKPPVFFEMARAALKAGGRAVLYAAAGKFEAGECRGRFEEIAYRVESEAGPGRERRLVIWTER